MSATYLQVGDIYPPRGDPRHAVTARLFKEATVRGVHALLIDDSQAGIGGAFGGYPLSLMLALNKITGTKIPGTPWIPAKARSGTGGFFPASQTFRNVNNVGTIDQTKYPPGFAGAITPSPSPVPHDVNSTDLAFSIHIMGDSARVEANVDRFAQGLTDLIDKDDTNWYTEVLLGRCNNASIHGGTAGAEVKVEAWRTNAADSSWGTGSSAQVLNTTSSGLALNTGTVDDPVRFEAGPIAFSTNKYISVTWRSTSAGSKVRVAGARVWKKNAPGWFVHTIQEGGYRTIDSSSWYASHANSMPFTRAMFENTPSGAPDVLIIGLGTNDFGSGKTAAQWKDDIKVLLTWLWAGFGKVIPTWIAGEPFRGDTTTSNYATWILELQQQAGVVKELIDEGYGGYGALFLCNNLLQQYMYYGLQDGTVLTGKTWLGDFADKVAGTNVTITQNTHVVSSRKQGFYQHWLYTGATTTIGSTGGINSERHGPGGDLFSSGANGTPMAIWLPVMPLFGRQGNVGPGLPNDYVHFCPAGQTFLGENLANSMAAGAMFSQMHVIGMAEPSRFL